MRNESVAFPQIHVDVMLARRDFWDTRYSAAHQDQLCDARETVASPVDPPNMTTAERFKCGRKYERIWLDCVQSTVRPYSLLRSCFKDETCMNGFKKAAREATKKGRHRSAKFCWGKLPCFHGPRHKCFM